jgi:hypothetical protein
VGFGPWGFESLRPHCRRECPAARYDPARGAVAQLAKAPVSKTGDSRFESWLPRLAGHPAKLDSKRDAAYDGDKAPPQTSPRTRQPADEPGRTHLMRMALRIGFVGVALVAVLVGCGSGRSTSTSEGKRVRKPSAPRAPEKIVVAHRVGPRRVERGEPTEVLSASPCSNTGVNGTTTVPVGREIGFCALVAPSGRLGVLNTTASPIQVEVGDYKMRLRSEQTGMIPASVRSYLGRGGHFVRVIGSRLRSRIWVLIPGCVLRWPAKPGRELCFPRWIRHRERVARRWRRKHPHAPVVGKIVAE